jgi:hypothetical protein
VGNSHSGHSILDGDLDKANEDGKRYHIGRIGVSSFNKFVGLITIHLIPP